MVPTITLVVVVVVGGGEGAINVISPCRQLIYYRTVREYASFGRSDDVMISFFCSKYTKIGKNNRQKQGSFFQSLFQVHSFNIRDFRASSADEEAFSLLFECQEQFRATLR